MHFMEEFLTEFSKDPCHSVPLRLWILPSGDKRWSKRCRPKHILHAGSLLIASCHLLMHLRVLAPQLLGDLANPHIPEEVPVVSVCFVWNV